MSLLIFNLWKQSPAPDVLTGPLQIPSLQEEIYIPLNPQNIAVDGPPLTVVQVTTELRIALYNFRNNDDDSLTVTLDVPQNADLTKKARVFLTYLPTNAGEIDFIIRVKGFKTGDPFGAAVSETQFNFSHIPTGANQWQSRVDLTGLNQQINLNPIESIVFQLIRDGINDANSGIVYPVSLVVQYFIIGQIIQP